MCFESDHTAGVHPQVIEAIVAAACALGTYNGDGFSIGLDEALAAVFERGLTTVGDEMHGSRRAGAHMLALAFPMSLWRAIGDAHTHGGEAADQVPLSSWRQLTSHHLAPADIKRAAIDLTSGR